jgi:5-(carboxyamino)imidazole ribonucleotide mutase
MPSGIPVATVAIDGAENAGLLAVQILSLKHQALKEKLIKHKNEMESAVIEKNNKIKEEVF